MKNRFEKLPPNTSVIDFKISEKNKGYIEKFLSYMQGHIVQTRYKKYKYILYRFADLIEKDFDKITREDARTASAIVANSKTLATSTKEDIISDVRRAIKYLFGNDEDLPDFIKPYKLTKYEMQKGILRLPKHILNEKETYSLIKACNNSRDKFFIALLGLDSAMRPCEAFRTKLKQIERDEYSHFITIETAKKSGDKETRVIRIIKSEPYYIQWMKDYPQEKNPENYLFINISNHKPMDLSTTHAENLELLERASKIENRPRNNFILTSALEKARLLIGKGENANTN